jgi:hypothetical protein
MTEHVPRLDQTRSRFDHIGRRIMPKVMPLEIAYDRTIHERAEPATQLPWWLRIEV